MGKCPVTLASSLAAGPKAITVIQILVMKDGFILCGWLLFSKTFSMWLGFVRCGLVFPLPGRRFRRNLPRGACLRGASGRWLSLSSLQAATAAQWMGSTNQVPTCNSNNTRSGQSTGCLGSRADNIPSLHWACYLLCSRFAQIILIR